MRRREFIVGLGGAVAWPVVAHAQQPPMPVIGVLHSQAPDLYTPMLAGFRQGLKEAGYVEGQNVLIEYRWAHGQLDRLPEMAADLVRRQVAAIVVSGSSAPAIAAKAATSTIPIVLAFGGDPVELGLVASLNRPGNNITGFTFFATASETKRLHLLYDMVPQADSVGYLFDPAFPTAAEQTGEMHAAARSLGLQLVVLEARNERDFEEAFATLIERRAGALVVATAPLFTSNRNKVLALAARQKIPAIYTFREYAEDGGLMSYGASQVETWRQAAVYVGRILKGAKPAELPIQLPTKFELVINLKTAKLLGLEVPAKILALADVVIE
jgi:putative tryptophan/tyrosine transport system substrate-binding protein